MPATYELDGSLIADPLVFKLVGSGDIDGDGIGDLACMTSASAPNWRGDSFSTEPYNIYILYGGRDLPGHLHPGRFPRRTRVSGVPGFGESSRMRIVGDLDGGGQGDLIYGFYNGSPTAWDDGIQVIRGESLYQAAEFDWADLPKLVIEMRLPQIGGVMDLDWNGDGISDLAISSAAGSREAVLLLYGGKEYLQSAGEIQLDDEFLEDSGEVRGVLLAGRDHAGSDLWAHNLVNAGDVDGDGAQDLLAGNAFVTPEIEGVQVPEAGEAYLLGRRSLENPHPYPRLVESWDPQPAAFYDPAHLQEGIFTIQAAYSHEWLGHTNYGNELSALGAGDLNGDGVPDIALGNWLELPAENGSLSDWTGLPYTYVLFGKRGWLDGGNVALRREEMKEGLLIRGAGTGVAVGDIDGDGVSDLIVSRRHSDAYILFGGPGLGSFRFRRGDANLDGAVDVSDAIGVLDYLFQGGQTPRCLDAADADDSGSVDLTDAVYLLGFLFLGSQAPPDPFPDLGLDPTEDQLGCEAAW